MKKLFLMVLSLFVFGSVFSSTAFADAKCGQKFYLKKMSGMCRKDGIKNDDVFAKSYTRNQSG